LPGSALTCCGSLSALQYLQATVDCKGREHHFPAALRDAFHGEREGKGRERKGNVDREGVGWKESFKQPALPDSYERFAEGWRWRCRTVTQTLADKGGWDMHSPPAKFVSSSSFNNLIFNFQNVANFGGLCLLSPNPGSFPLIPQVSLN